VPRSLRLFAPSCVVGALVLGAVGGWADSTVVSVRVEYAAAQGCPDALGFGEELHARARVKFVGDKDAPHALAVRITRVGKHFEGKLVVRDASAEASERRVSGDTCAEVVSGLALVSAFALGFSPPTAEPPDAQPDIATPDTMPVVVVRDASPERERPVATIEAPTVDASTTAAPTPTPAPQPWSFGVGAQGQLLSDVSPNLAFAVPMHFEVRRSMSGKLGVAARLRFVRASSTAAGAFTLTAGGVDLCPLDLFSRPFRFDLCARVVAGAFDATGVGVIPSRSATRPWVSVGSAASLDLYVLGPLYLRLEAALDAPLVRDRFFVEPNETLFSAPAIGWTGAFGAGATIW
jgi:hypothetical protein